jgi:hypothetical protein
MLSNKDLNYIKILLSVNKTYKSCKFETLQNRTIGSIIRHSSNWATYTKNHVQFLKWYKCPVALKMKRKYSLHNAVKSA